MLPLLILTSFFTGSSIGHSPTFTGTPPSPQPIVGGELVEEGDWTSVVAIVSFDTLNPSDVSPSAKLCSGVLLHPQVVLTAGHCLVEISDIDNMAVIFGTSIYNTSKRVVAEVADYAIHPQFCRDNCNEREGAEDAFDFGIVTLSTQTQGVTLIEPLVEQNHWDEAMQIGNSTTVVGFGATREPQEDDMPLTMQELGFKREVSLGIRRISETGFEFIAGNDGKDTCPGDSGGPSFVRLSDGSFRLAGISSRGVPPCGVGTGYYGTVYAALPWIYEQTGINLLPPGCTQTAVADEQKGDSCLDTKKSSGCQIDPTYTSSHTYLSLLTLLSFFWMARRRLSTKIT